MRSVFSWSDNSTDTYLLTVDSGSYSVTVTDSASCSYSDTIQISYLPELVVELGTNQMFCYLSTVPITSFTQNASSFKLVYGCDPQQTYSLTQPESIPWKSAMGFCFAYDTVFYELIHYPHGRPGARYELLSIGCCNPFCRP